MRLKDQTNLQVDGLFPCIGQIPTTDFLKKLNILTEDGYIEVNSNFETKQKGIYAIGDCIKKRTLSNCNCNGRSSSMRSKSFGGGSKMRKKLWYLEEEQDYPIY